MTPVAIPGTVIRPHASPTYLPSGKRGFLTRPNSMVMVAARVLPACPICVACRSFPPGSRQPERWERESKWYRRRSRVRARPRYHE